jgi:Helix-turn-helix domain
MALHPVGFRFLLSQEECFYDMNKTFQYRLYPTKKQQTTLNEWLALCCETYNAALQERRNASRLAGILIGYSRQCAELPDCKEARPELTEVHSQVLQDVVKRVDLAFAAFFRRCQAVEKPGYPRYRSRSLAMKSSQTRATRLMHRSVLMSASRPLHTSDGSQIENPCFFRQEEHTLARRNTNSPKQRAKRQKRGSGARWWHASMSASPTAGRTSLGSELSCWSGIFCNKPWDDTAESLQKPSAWSRRESSQIAHPSLLVITPAALSPKLRKAGVTSAILPPQFVGASCR